MFFLVGEETHRPRHPLGRLHHKCHSEGHLPCRRSVEESDVLPGEALEHGHAAVSHEESSDEVHRDFEPE